MQHTHTQCARMKVSVATNLIYFLPQLQPLQTNKQNQVTNCQLKNAHREFQDLVCNQSIQHAQWAMQKSKGAQDTMKLFPSKNRKLSTAKCT